MRTHFDKLARDNIPDIIVNILNGGTFIGGLGTDMVDIPRGGTFNQDGPVGADRAKAPWLLLTLADANVPFR